MPRVNLNKPQRDEMKEMLMGRKAALRLTNEDIGEKLNLSPNAIASRFAKPSEKWRLGDLIRMCKVLDIPKAEMLERIRF